MAIKTFLGESPTRPNIWYVYLAGTTATTQIMYATVARVAFSFQAGSTDPLTVMESLRTTILASTDPMVTECTFDAPDNVGGSTDALMYVTGPSNGAPISLAVSNSSGSGTLTAASSVAALSPDNWESPYNWTGAAVPASGDTIIFDRPFNLRWNIDRSTEAYTVLLDTTATDGAEIGLSLDGNGYPEWRNRYLKSSSATITLTSSNGGAGGPSLCNIDLNGAHAAIKVESSGSGSNRPAIQIFNSGTNTTLVMSGSAEIGLAMEGTQACVITGATIGNGTLSVGAGGRVISNLIQHDGTVTYAGRYTGSATTFAGTTFTKNGGTLIFTGTQNVGASTVTNRNGDITWIGTGGNSAATIVMAGGTIDFSQDPAAKSFGKIELYRGTGLNIGNTPVTLASGAQLIQCDATDLSRLSVGSNKVITIT